MEVELVQVATARLHNGSTEVAVKPALEFAGLEDAESLRFHADEGQIVAAGLAQRVDGRSHDHARPLKRNTTVQVTIPPADADVLGAHPDDLNDDNPTRLAVFAAADSGLLAFRRADEVTTTADLEAALASA